MKKLSLICVATLLGMSLAGCGNNSSHKATSSSRTSSSKVVKHHKKNSSKKQSSSSSSAASQQVVSQPTTQQSGNAQSTNQASNSVATAPQAGNLSDFVNRYGESPAAYMMDHYGMSQSQALNSVPDNMKSSGELQYQEGVRQGYIQP